MEANNIEPQPDAVSESTLDSEIDALSKIITDTKDGGQKLEDNEDFKIDSDDIVFATDSQCDSVECGMDDPLPGASSTQLSNTDSPKQVETLDAIVTESSLQEKSEGTSQKLETDFFVSTTSSDTIDQNAIIETDTCNSLSLINEAYNSQESESCSDSQPASILGMEEVLESANLSEPHDTTLSTPMTEKVVLLEENNKGQLDNESIEKIVEPVENLVDSNYGNDNYDQPDFIQSTDAILTENSNNQCTFPENIQKDEPNKGKQAQLTDIDLDEKQVENLEKQQSEIQNDVEKCPIEVDTPSNQESDHQISESPKATNETLQANESEEMDEPVNEIQNESKIINTSLGNAKECNNSTDLVVVQNIDVEGTLSDAEKCDEIESIDIDESIGLSFDISKSEATVSENPYEESNVDCTQKTEECEDVDPLSNTDNNENEISDSGIITPEDKEPSESIMMDVQSLPETEIMNDAQSLQDTEISENTEALQDIIADTGIESLENTEADSNFETLQDVESLREEGHTDNEHSKEVEENVVESQKTKTLEDTKHSSASQIGDCNLKEVFSQVSNSNEKEPHLSHIEQIDNPVKDIIEDDQVPDKDSRTTVEDEPMDENLSVARVETPEDLNLTLELDDPEEKISSDIKGVKESLKESEVEKQIESIMDQDQGLPKKAFEKDDSPQKEVNESLNPATVNPPPETEQLNPPSEEDISIDPTTANNALNKSVESCNTNLESREPEQNDLSPILETENQITLEPQKITAGVDNLINKDLNSDVDQLLKNEDDPNMDVGDTQSLVDRPSDCAPLLAQKDETVVEPGIKESVEKEEDITLMFEESSQSPKQTENNNSETVLDNVPIESNQTEFHNINMCDEPTSHSEQNLEEDELSLKNIHITLESESKEQDSKSETLNEKSAEISELESAVKFLQESEEQDIQNSELVENNSSTKKGEDNSSIFVSVEDNVCDAVLETPDADLDPIAISEAEIISEAAKLESERKEKLVEQVDVPNNMDVEASALISANEVMDTAKPKNLVSPEATNENISTVRETSTELSLDTPVESSIDQPEIESENYPKLSELPKTNLLNPKDLKQRLDSPDRSIISEPKISDTPKKESSDKQQQHLEFENVGSPRIILKIAKSAITECSEPRSPKSPKIRSAANSPNPEDSPGHKLGKIKLKLSKGGHPSIISNSDNYDETAQWHTDSTSLHSPLGMKIKLTKTSDLETRHEEIQKQEEIKEKPFHKLDEGKKTEASIGMKIKLSKSGDASIIQQDNKEISQESSVSKKQESPPIGMKIKLSKTGDASIIQQDSNIQPILESTIDEIQDCPRRTETTIGMKIKLSKSGDASVVPPEPSESVKETLEMKDKIEEPLRRTDSPIGVKIKLAKTKDGNASIIATERTEEPIKMEMDSSDDISKTGLGMKIKISKSGDHASVVHSIKEVDSPVDSSKKAFDQPIGMKIKLSKTGDPSIVHPEVLKDEDASHNVKTKHSKSKDYGTSSQQKPKDDTHLEMKIKLSKNGHPTIISNEHSEDPLRITSIPVSQSYKHKDLLNFKESTLKAIKKSHSEVTIEPVTNQAPTGSAINKRKDITIAPMEPKKSKTEPNLKQMLPDITIQPITSAAKKELHNQKLLIDSEGGSISQQQMNVINREISITQICSLTTGESLMGDHLKSSLNIQHEQSGSSPLNSDCEIIDPQPEMVFVNENSNSSQDVMIIDEVPPTQSITKVPKKRGRPRRNPVTSPAAATFAPITSFQNIELQKDPLSIDQPTMHMRQHQLQPGQIASVANAEGSERPRRTCRSQKSYAPPKRGRGRGRGKRKHEVVDIPMKKVRVDQDLFAIEASTTAVITLEKLPISPSGKIVNPELIQSLKSSTLIRSNEHKKRNEFATSPQVAHCSSDCEIVETHEMDMREIKKDRVLDFVDQGSDLATTALTSLNTVDLESAGDKSGMVVGEVEMSGGSDAHGVSTEKMNSIVIKVTEDDDKVIAEQAELAEGGKEIQDYQNWLAPTIKKIPNERESISTLAVMDEETRMSAESGSRSQTPARNMSIPGGSETLVNEESQNSVLSTATTESEKVKVKNRRMEINFDPDEGPFTVEKIAEYEWPIDKKEERPPVRGETFMIQEQISQYLGVKSFKRKYPDLKRRIVDMEERNYLRENGLVSEAMCDMGLTAISSSEVLDIMCSDFPEQYEEYRKYMREKAAKEHSKKQKELSAAANAERNRIDLAEMAMQSAISWNANLNKTRKDSRNSSLDLQTFTVQVPKRHSKFNPARRGHNYPVALIPGQYTDFYREYSAAELRYFPLNTVLYGPMRPNERKFDSQSEGSQSDSDSDSSSDDSSSSSSEGTQDTEGSQSTMDEVDMELAIQPDVKCKICLNNLNKSNRPETLIQCGTCSGNVHPSCIDLTLDMVPHIRAYAWQCTDCKTCAQCHDPADEDKMLFCDMCDRGYHIYCVGLRRVPQGRWHCQECAVCANCGSKEPGGANSDRNSVAQWQHEYKKGDRNTRVYVSTFCVPCSKMRGNQGTDN